MTDILVSFRWQISPDQRGLYHKPGMSRWYFPNDYPEKVAAAVKHLTLPTTRRRRHRHRVVIASIHQRCDG
jgi:hypothetical protein